MPDMTSDAGRPVQQCFVHIGLQKTGTSYLQSIMWQSRDALRQQGLVMVPGSKAETFTLMLALRGRLREGVDPQSAYDAPARLRDLVAGESAPRLLLTEESIAPATVEQVRVLAENLPGVEVHVVLTVRDLARAIPSVWQQKITGSGRQPLDAYLEDVVGRSRRARSFWASQDLPAVLERWSVIAPPERIHVVTVPPSGTPPEVLLERFCSVIGVDPAALDREVPRANESLGQVQAELLRRVNVARRPALAPGGLPGHREDVPLPQAAGLPGWRPREGAGPAGGVVPGGGGGARRGIALRRLPRGRFCRGPDAAAGVLHAR
jgi:hypothetical protein